MRFIESYDEAVIAAFHSAREKASPDMVDLLDEELDQKYGEFIDRNPPPPRAGVLRRAEQLTCGPRNRSYGSPVGNMAETAKLWSAFLGVEITGAQVATCMALVKIARLRTSPDHMDSHDDAAAYMAIAYECAVSASEMTKDS